MPFRSHAERRAAKKAAERDEQRAAATDQVRERFFFSSAPLAFELPQETAPTKFGTLTSPSTMQVNSNMDVDEEPGLASAQVTEEGVSGAGMESPSITRLCTSMLQAQNVITRYRSPSHPNTLPIPCSSAAEQVFRTLSPARLQTSRNRSCHPVWTRAPDRQAGRFLA
jgi:hypothetical protein